MRARPLDPIDFEPREVSRGARWPFDYDALLPWYTSAFEFLGLHGRRPSSSPDSFLAGVERTEAYFAAPQTFRTLARQLAADGRLSVFPGSTLVSVADLDGEIASIRCSGPDSGAVTVSARTFVLAGGGIENARMLLLSDFGRPGGRANPHDQVGRHFMEHLHVDSGLLKPGANTVDWLTGIGRGSGADPRAATFLRLGDAVQREHGLANAIVEFRDVAPAEAAIAGRALADLRWSLENRAWAGTRARLREVAMHPLGVSRVIAQKARPARRTERGLVFTTEQSPLPESRVTLGTKKDQFGLPLARLAWRVAPSDLESLRRTQDFLDAALRVAEAGAIHDKWGESTLDPRIDGCFHAMGTTRMSSDATTGVVDADCRVHEMRNLWIAGSSVMPTGGAATVTLTIVALALRLADHLDGVLRS